MGQTAEREDRSALPVPSRESLDGKSLSRKVALRCEKALHTRTNGLPDIKVAALTAVRLFENQFKEYIQSQTRHAIGYGARRGKLGGAWQA
jgi:hypothetical protein